MPLSALCGEETLLSRGGGFTASRASLPSGFFLPPEALPPVGTMRGSDSWMPSIFKCGGPPSSYSCTNTGQPLKHRCLAPDDMQCSWSYS